eukprot:scaffold129827_cov18-Tisochrysis_lutea.AAC.1
MQQQEHPKQSAATWMVTAPPHTGLQVCLTLSLQPFEPPWALECMEGLMDVPCNLKCASLGQYQNLIRLMCKVTFAKHGCHHGATISSS